MSLIQINVPSDIKEKADKAFSRSGLTTPMAMKILITQVANSGHTPFDNLFTKSAYKEYSEEVSRAMIREEAMEYGFIPDTAKVWTGDFDDETLEILGLTREELESDV
ncbi:type II toxin-antitoxin system RelB/DinJ family antitoxin [Lactovum odontotermitis]